MVLAVAACGEGPTPPAATRLAITVQPSNATAGAAIAPAVQVAIQTATGATVTTATNALTVAIDSNLAGGTLSGTATVSAVNGVATFANLSIDRAGTGYTLAVSAGGLTDATSTAFNIVAPLTFTAVAAGGAGQGSHTCGVTTDGAIYCWGFNGRGQLGDGTHTDRFVPTLVQGPAGVTFQAVSAGGQHTCAVASTGDAYCWGRNEFGQLGDNTTGDKPVPVPVGAPAGVTFATLDAGYVHTCAVTPAGAAYCWGDNGSGELGDNTTVGKLVPTAVQGAIQFALVSGGGDHSCGVTTTGKGYCWGGNEAGQIGDNTTLDRLVPAANAGNLTLSIPAPGNGHSCAVATGTSATVYCWGSNAHGQLGDGTTSQRLVPTRVAR